MSSQDSSEGVLISLHSHPSIICMLSAAHDTPHLAHTHQPHVSRHVPILPPHDHGTSDRMYFETTKKVTLSTSNEVAPNPNPLQDFLSLLKTLLWLSNAPAVITKYKHVFYADGGSALYVPRADCGAEAQHNPRRQKSPNVGAAGRSQAQLLLKRPSTQQARPSFTAPFQSQTADTKAARHPVCWPPRTGHIHV